MVQPSKIYVLFSKPTIYALGVAGAATAAAAGLGAVAGAATAAAAVGVLDAKGFDVPQEPSGRGQWKLGGGKSMACVRK